MSATAEAAAALQRMNLEIDVRHVLPTVQAPTLLIHAKDDRAVPVGASRQMAEAIPNATLIEIESGDHLPFYDKPDEIIGHIQNFLTGGTTPDPSSWTKCAAVVRQRPGYEPWQSEWSPPFAL